MLTCGMEGIEDGQAVDTCFFCLLLYPGGESCSRCGNRLRYLPAAMSPPEAPSEHLGELVKQFQGEASKVHAITLLECMHRYPEEVETMKAVARDALLTRLRHVFEQDDAHEET